MTKVLAISATRYPDREDPIAMRQACVCVCVSQDPASGEKVEKNVFVVFSSGERSRNKVNKVCVCVCVCQASHTLRMARTVSSDKRTCHIDTHQDVHIERYTTPQTRDAQGADMAVCVCVCVPHRSVRRLVPIAIRSLRREHVSVRRRQRWTEGASCVCVCVCVCCVQRPVFLLEC